MTIPGFIFGALFATLYGSLFHLATGGGFARLLGDIALAWLGFWMGHLFAAARGWEWGMVGVLHFAPATLSAAFWLVLGHYLAPPAPPPKSSD